MIVCPSSAEVRTVGQPQKVLVRASDTVLGTHTGPTPASPPVAQAQASSRFGLNAQKLLDEVRSHGITFSDDDAAKLVQIGDANVARNEPDLTADDPQIRRQLTQMFPSLTDDQAKIETSCLAEYVEREIARQHNTVPPDERDDYGG
jgi:hypothetical protein